MARFDEGTISSDGGAFLLRQTDRRLNLLARLAQCFLDGRNPDLVEHSVLEMLSQRVYGLALGYEDLNNYEQLRKDPVFGVLAGQEELEQPLAGKSTLNFDELPGTFAAVHTSGTQIFVDCIQDKESRGPAARLPLIKQIRSTLRLPRRRLLPKTRKGGGPAVSS